MICFQNKHNLVKSTMTTLRKPQNQVTFIHLKPFSDRLPTLVKHFALFRCFLPWHYCLLTKKNKDKQFINSYLMACYLPVFSHPLAPSFQPSLLHAFFFFPTHNSEATFRFRQSLIGCFLSPCFVVPNPVCSNGKTYKNGLGPIFSNLDPRRMIASLFHTSLGVCHHFWSSPYFSLLLYSWHLIVVCL